MKNAILLFAAMVLSIQFSLHAQTPPSDNSIWVDSIDINTLEDLHYIRIQFVVLKFNEESRVIVDYGENADTYQFGRSNLTDATGERITFRTKVQGLNFFYNRGWKFVFTEGADYYLERRGR
jgi:hypothetical protein